MNGQETMQLGCPLDLSGLRTALAIEEAGQWHLYDPERDPAPSDAQVEAVYQEIMAFNSKHVPLPDTRYLRLMVDAAAALHGHNARRWGWSVIGVNPTSGRRILGEEDHTKVSWQLWFTAMSFGLGFARYETEAEYLAPQDLERRKT
ncbi:hypothetical protein KM176_22305 [Pseudooceanicola sp. CBS1P-1]|uniref:Uncharacterized protein n=1 Tax=Pseudooceanicola albus TaxID=2692189 RepID=A0A6L7G928_9RHOB|nr:MULTISPECIES: hypothetical protein [Pseudooceanicola]MBT9386608.1 hypothetical protein [Pseudooceanicola endophyticus]MXN20724.1 hypothetical protein [Pseudooceanicola albus]